MDLEWLAAIWVPSDETEPASSRSGETEPVTLGEMEIASLGSGETEPVASRSGETEPVALGETEPRP